MSPDKTEIAWAAGLFEGEGCIHIGARNAGLMLRTTDHDVLVKFHRIVECGNIRGPLPVAEPHHKPSWDWRAGSQADREAVLAAFLPWLGARRRERAQQMLDLPRIYHWQRAKSHCKNGHPFDGPDSDVHLTVDASGQVTVRRCRHCERRRNRAYKARQREKAAA